MKFYKLILQALVTFLIFPVIIQAQVAVEKSKDKVVIDGKQYYIHITKKGETAYSISKAYGISVQDLRKENPFMDSGLKAGQSLRISIVEKSEKPVTTVKTNKPSRDNSKYIYHKLVAGETAFSLSKKYGVSEDEIVQGNPGLEINKMPLGYEIAIPRRQFNVTETKLPAPEKNIIQHKVVKGENLYSIAEKYGITVKELRRENKGLLFPKVDEYIRVPVPVVAEIVNPEMLKTDSAATVKEIIINQPERPSEITPVTNLKGSFNIAFLVPLYF